VSMLFRATVSARRAAYRAGLLRTSHLPVPVIVVGNITAGGTGKTPLILWLAVSLKLHGWAPGIVCRGYGGLQGAPQAVVPASDPYICGDEAVLLARRSGCPVWTGANRVAAARSLLAANACDIVLSDDGLQHYALARDLEICVVDGDRVFGNGWLLPAGPLREPPSRLSQVDAVIVNGRDATGECLSSLRKLNTSCVGMGLEPSGFWNLRDSDRRVDISHFRGKRVHAVAGIGNPPRFFRQLRELGIEIAAHAFPDHHAFRAHDLVFSGTDEIVMTEKDAVKCQRFASDRCWAMAVDAVPDTDLENLVLSKLASLPASKAR